MLISVVMVVYFTGFSALQRAENSSISITVTKVVTILLCFSALQRAENSSIHISSGCAVPCAVVSVLFSEPKIPQYV